MSYQEWDDRRKYKRYMSEMPVRFNRIGETVAPGAEGNVLNISRGGVFVHTTTPLPVGTDLQMKVRVITPFGDAQEIESQAKVVWVTTRGGEEGMGLSFTKIDRHSQYAMLACAYRGHD
jgi:hypothetical protein